MEREENTISLIRKATSSLRFIIPLIAIFFGFIYWLEGVKYFIKDIAIRSSVSGFIFIGFWIFTLFYLFKGFIRINFLSKILVLLIAFSVSSNFHVMLWYNQFSECFFMVVLTPEDMLIIRVASYLSILGVIPIVIAIISPHFQSELNYLTNITRIKDRESKKRYIFLEIWTSFPVFMGIHIIFFLVFVINDRNRCLDMPFNYVIILVLPWLFLMVFHIIYSSVIGLMK